MSHSPPPEPSLGARLHRLTVAQYEHMAASGVLTPDDQVELLEGLLVEKMTKNPPHRIATRKVRLALERVVPSSHYVDTQEPIVTADSEPEPDVAVIAGETDHYGDTHPPASAVALVVEVAEATLAADRQRKGRVYARAGIPSYWIVNLASRAVEAYSRPAVSEREARYLRLDTYEEGRRVPLFCGEERWGEVAVSDLLPDKM